MKSASASISSSSRKKSNPACPFSNINEIPPFDKDNPSAENIARWLFKKLSADLNSGGVRIKKVEIYEMPNCGASYYE